MRDSKGISDDQMKEFRNSFNFFDKVCHAKTGVEQSRADTRVQYRILVLSVIVQVLVIDVILLFRATLAQTLTRQL